MERFLAQHPEYAEDLRKKVLLTALIYGGFYSYLIYKGEDLDTVLDRLSRLEGILGDGS